MRIRTPHLALLRLIAQGIFRKEVSELTPAEAEATLRATTMVALAGFRQPRGIDTSPPKEPTP